jgi:hypothetical protein
MTGIEKKVFVHPHIPFLAMYQSFLFLFFMTSTSLVSGRVLRGITQIVIPPAPASGSSSNGAAYSSGTFAPVTFAPPSGNTAPPPQVTTAAFQTYSASFPSAVTLNWAAASTPFSFDTSNIANLNVNNLGGNFAVIKTAPYTYSPSTR